MKTAKKLISIALVLIIGTAFTLTIDTVEVSAVSAPAKVKWSTCKATSSSAVKLSWKKVKNASGYEIYKNGKIYKRTDKTSLAVTKLKANTKYTFKIKAYKNYKKKQYYNTTKKKWQNNKPKKKDWKGKKTRRKTLRKYGKISAAKAITTLKAPSAALLFPVIKDTCLSYQGTTIYLGQTWTSDICTALKNVSNGYESVVRPKIAFSEVTNNYCDTTVYLFDIKDYSNFLAVYVAGGQVVRWATNGPVFGTVNGKDVVWGDTVADYSHGMQTGYRTPYAACADIFTDIDVNDTVVGGFSGYDYTNTTGVPEKEKRVGFHYLNAYRAKAGLVPFIYSDGLDGKNNTWSGTVDGREYNNIRYGAQPFVETVAASAQVNHNTATMTAGPLAGISSDDRDAIIFTKTGIKIIAEIVATGGLGESCLGSYMSASANGHLAAIVTPSMARIGIGISGQYNGADLAR